jgi:IS5 family transposase
MRILNIVREQQLRQRGQKLYSLHAPEVECIGKGKAHRPYEFGVKSPSQPRYRVPRAASSSYT